MKLTREVIETFEYEVPVEEVDLFNDKYPSLLSVNAFGRTWELRPFALCVVIAAVCALALLWLTARRSGLKKATPATVGLLLLPFGLVFARAFYVLAAWGWYSELGLSRALFLWEGGYAIWGAVLGCALAVLTSSRLTKEKPSLLFDACAAPMALFIALCRFASYPFTGEGRGRLLETGSFFCRFPFAVQEEGEWFRAVFMLEGIIALVILLILLFSHRQGGDKARLFLILYAAAQILCESLHKDPGKMVWHQFVRIPQLASAVVLGLVFLSGVLRRAKSFAPRRVAELAVLLLHGVALVIGMEFAIEKLPLFPVWVYYAIMADSCFMIGYAAHRAALSPLHPEAAPARLSARRITEMALLLLHGAALVAGGISLMGKLSIFPVWACIAIMADGIFLGGYALCALLRSPSKCACAFLLLMLPAGLALAPAPVSADKSVLISFTGDCTIGSTEDTRWQSDSFVSVVSREGYAYPFANFRTLFEQDDCTIVNLEGILSDSKYDERKDKTYRFRGDKAFAAILAEGSVEACGLANNHFKDYGKQGQRNTMEAVTEAGLSWFWNMTPYVLEKDGIRVAFFAVDENSYIDYSEELRAEIVRLKESGEANAVVVCFHSGVEYGAHRYRTQEERSRTLIKYKTDLIIMNHAHVVQGIDIVGNRTVCYALGNFVFGGNKEIRSKTYGNRIVTARYALVVQARLDFTDDGEYLGQQITLIPVFTSSDPEKNYYQPIPVRGEDAAAVIDAVQFDTDFQLPEIIDGDPFSRVELPYLPAQPGE